MERIKTFIQRLQEVYYSKHPKSAIDIDLMLDYTRVMYIDLLEWRKEFTAPVQSDIAGLMEAHPAESAIKETSPTVAEKEPAPIEKPKETETPPPPVEEPKPAAPVIEEPKPAEEETSDISAAAERLTEEMQAEVDQTNEEVLPVAPQKVTPDVVHHFPEAESIEVISKEHSGISFEPPTAPEKSQVVADTIVEEAPSETHIAEEIPVPAPAEIPLPEFKPYSAARLFDGIVEMKDIRTSIGINDKYLFLNELFNNHKSDYEETLDKINRFDNVAAAIDWVKTKAPATQKWDAADSTVQSFYALVDKHFKAR